MTICRSFGALYLDMAVVNILQIVIIYRNKTEEMPDRLVVITLQTVIIYRTSLWSRYRNQVVITLHHEAHLYAVCNQS